MNNKRKVKGNFDHELQVEIFMPLPLTQNEILNLFNVSKRDWL